MEWGIKDTKNGWHGYYLGLSLHLIFDFLTSCAIFCPGLWPIDGAATNKVGASWSSWIF
jgi:membrane-bound metal-dependent hydrolase YbcI (DUF457 family)